MQPVWVMNEDDKARAGCGVMILLAIAGGIWCWTWLFPSESSRLSDASSAQHTITRNEQSLRSTLETVKLYTSKNSFTSDDLTRAGSELEHAKKLVAESSTQIATLQVHANHLKRSNNVSTQLQAAGYEKFAGEAKGRLDAFKENLKELEQALAAKLK